MKSLLNSRILCLSLLVFVGGCTLDSLGSTQYLEGIRNTSGSINSSITNVSTNVITNITTNTNTVTTNTVTNVLTNNVTNFTTNIVTNNVTNFTTNVVTNSVTNVLTNTVTNLITNTVTNTVTNVITNTITNGDDPSDTRSAQTKFLDAIKGRNITITDSINVISSGTVSTDGRQISTNTATYTTGNAGAPAALILSSVASPYKFQGIADSTGHVGTYYGEHISNNTSGIGTIDKTTLLIVVTLNAKRTGGTISSYRYTYKNYYDGSSVASYPGFLQFNATFTIPQ